MHLLLFHVLRGNPYIVMKSLGIELYIKDMAHISAKKVQGMYVLGSILVNIEIR